ncbi:DUF89 family protein [Desulfohalobiaceae bacterium Ax17]|uniref:ARMT1-like domain-containing protein n=1 Tax=Desulfovulcanus ferrireducens TaxID=2831190 RepID=UPI00207BAD41|nr:ARMT1-like domain-containing protein [Desulfovulcanus ferrireducens]MBT8763797.1 DUF89 family protein [Desulfovulcanus ferrireducens]
MPNLPKISSVLELYYGRDPYLDAWLLHFMTENNIEHLANPRENASPEQMRFMVDLDENQVFAPCSDWMLKNLLMSKMTEELRLEYRSKWRQLVTLIKDFTGDEYIKKKVLALCRHKFQKVFKSPFVIPSRLIKRLLTIFLSQTAQQDPFEARKREFNKRAKRVVESPLFFRFLSACPSSTMGCQRIQDLRWELDLLELKRLFCLSTWDAIWKNEHFAPETNLVNGELAKIWDEFDQVMTKLMGPGIKTELKILYLPNSAGGILFDIMVIKSLIRQGHKVILALKEGFYYDYPVFWDYENDPILAEELKGATFLENHQVSKRELLKALRENDLVVISDGTRERLNLCRTSVTFARAWKESDLIFAKGEGNFRRLIMTSHKFTRDILAFYRDKQGQLHFAFKEKSPRVRKVTEKEILAKAEEIKRQMREAKANGQKVMFYSAIVGSIPGQTKVAINILNRFVDYLRSRLDGTFIINPAEHFEPGLDGDDLMYMWEIVQRSGLIDVWRFQTVADIEKSFELMGQKVPPIWAGKDATFSTGCTKEMQIALEEQRKYPEMQIIGPSPEKFFRRREYGVGKFFDASIER